jgi:hypothetical protein
MVALGQPASIFLERQDQGVDLASQVVLNPRDIFNDILESHLSDNKLAHSLSIIPQYPAPVLILLIAFEIDLDEFDLVHRLKVRVYKPQPGIGPAPFQTPLQVALEFGQARDLTERRR